MEAKISTMETKIMTLEQLRARLADRNLRRVAEAAGVHPHTLYRFMGEGNRPLYATVLALSEYFARQETEING
jgi:DNA-binding phage protein